MMLCSWSLVTLLLLAAPASAISITVDLDPSQPGIQTIASVPVGAPLAVDVVILSVSIADPLIGFEFDLRFDPTRLTALWVEDGDFFPNPIALETDLTPPDVGVARLNGGAAVSGQGVLVRIHFDAIAAGIVDLGLLNVVLSNASGDPLTVTVASDRRLTLVPEPTFLVPLTLGFAWVVGVRRASR